jgi:pSer/pThr/pTyr-binding forkhead associated (FHA) protein/tetratricopeptide (TPR) repeat protein
MVAKSVLSPRLVIIEGKDKGKVIPLQNGTAVIGRSKGDVLVQDPRVSRSHIALHYDERSGHLTFTDLKSLNGSLVNGDRQDSGELHDGDRLQLGNTIFDCQISIQDEKPGGKFGIRSPFKRKETSQEIAGDPGEPSISMADDLSSRSHATQDSEPTHHGFVPNIKRAYLHIPPRLRVIGLCIIIIFVGFRYSLYSGTPAKEMADTDLEAVRALATQGKVEAAIAKAVSIRDKNPTNGKVALVLAQLYEGQGKWELAISSYQKYLESSPTDIDVQFKLVDLYLEAGLPKPAQETFLKLEQMVKDGPRTQALFKGLARLLLEHHELSEPPERVFIIAKALQNEYAPDDPAGYKLEAQIQLQQNHGEDAIAALLKARKFAPDDEWVIENIAFAKLMLKDMNGALETLEEWTRQKPASSKPLLVLAYLKYNEKDLQGALQFTQKVLQVTANNTKDPHLPEALNLMGQIYIQENQVQEAEDSLRRSCELGFHQACENELLKRAPTTTTPAPETPPATKQ